MNLMSDLNSELIVSVLVEKKHREKIETKDVPVLITRLKNALQKINSVERFDGIALAASKSPNLPA